MKMSDLGTGALDDGIFVREDWIEDGENRETADKFLQASFRGWIYCRDNPDACVDIVLKNGPTLGEGHQRWQLNEINALIWPNETGIGIMNAADFQRTADIAKQFKVISKPASKDAYRTDLAQAAYDSLKEYGKGADWQKAEVEVTEGGK